MSFTNRSDCKSPNYQALDWLKPAVEGVYSDTRATQVGNCGVTPAGLEWHLGETRSLGYTVSSKPIESGPAARKNGLLATFSVRSPPVGKSRALPAASVAATQFDLLQEMCIESGVGTFDVERQALSVMPGI